MHSFIKKPRLQPGPAQKTVKDQIIERFEQKYIIHPSLVPEIREFITPFCIPDPNGKGDIPEYVVTTLQLDSPNQGLVLAKENKAYNRFKLRIRTYGEDSLPGDPVFLEVKRKSGEVIIKSRTKMKRATYAPAMFRSPEAIPMLKTPKDNANLLEFVRLVKTIGARPSMLIRYVRESYFGANDDYARVTMDRRICYRPSSSWDLPGPDLKGRRHWRSMDTQEGLNRPYPGYVFELKSMRDAPTWMMELIERFSLKPNGFSKYATAHRLESAFRTAACNPFDHIEGF